MKKSSLIRLLACAAALLSVVLLIKVWGVSYRQTRSFVEACENYPQIQAIIEEVEQSAAAFVSSIPYAKPEGVAVMELPKRVGDEELQADIRETISGLGDAMKLPDAKDSILAIIRENYSENQEEYRLLIGKKAIQQAYEEITPQLAELYKEAEKQVVLRITGS